MYQLLCAAAGSWIIFQLASRQRYDVTTTHQQCSIYIDSLSAQRYGLTRFHALIVLVGLQWDTLRCHLKPFLHFDCGRGFSMDGQSR